MRSVGIIPARGNSKRIEKKNIRDLDGKPLVVYTIEAAIESDLDFVVLSSEDDEVISESMKWITDIYGETPDKFFAIVRPEELSQDHVQTDSVITHCLYQVQYIGLNPRAICLLQPTSPFRTADHIDEAMAIFKNNMPCTVFSGHFADGFYWEPNFDSNQWGHIEAEPLGIEPRLRPGTQWIQKSEKLFKENGAIYITDTAKLAMTKTKFNPPYLAYEMDSESSIDIDTEEEWQETEKILAPNPLHREWHNL